MRNLAALIVVAFLAPTGGLDAQQSTASFNARQFFEELTKRGVDTHGIDGRKFFDDLANRGVTSKTPVDGRRFFEELANRGVNTKGVDGNIILGDVQDSGVMLPDMVLINRPPLEQ